ncbi:MAG TPA: 50S ribosomal protein L23 [Candidatus Hydrogenedentes bacterium]|nr:50S ribosomal protein L23 [Candidatus Hydrogenedentota bacterium]HOJ68062.1 50S ribosomal protein L23 [Candidatus Hydrogenedentota bacterium]HOK88832.1 50S ribosomal protein L23 [Candidatus Hydrogenedentota bacterium]HOV60650.1 50S ribosomal protein L23 [Candidatus Hydrogenedentota bacterium]HPO31508.1 50S ribosomal protein L23 [Candidatus Hydrogenedentota bacterium]
MKIDPYQIVERPIVTEEAQIQIARANQYTFRVRPWATKSQIRDAIEEIFKKDGIRVVSVNTMNYAGKVRNRLGRRNPGRRPAWKKAIVTLRPGDKIELI